MSGPSLEQLFESEDAELRRQAVARAGAQNHEYSLDLLFRGLSDVDWRVRKEAVAALREHTLSQQALDRLVNALLPGEDVGLRNAAVQALGAHGEASVQAVGARLGELDEDGLKLASEALALTGHAAAMPWLGKLRDHSDPNVRAAAIEAVANVGRAAPEAASRLLDEALDESDPFLKLVTLDVIRRLGLAPTWERLRALLGDPVLSSTGLELAARLGEPRSAPHFVRELERVLTHRPPSEADVTRASELEARALRYLCRFTEASSEALAAAESALGGLSLSARDRMLELCAAPSDEPHGRDALLLLALLQDQRVARRALLALQDESSSQAGFRAVELLGIGMTDVLLEELRDGDEQQRATAVRLLAAIAGREPAPGISAVLSALTDSSSTVVRAWVDAMVAMGDQAGLERTLYWLGSEAPAAVRFSARKAARAFRERYPERARELARSAPPDEARAECICWFMATPEPLLSPEADLEFLAVASSGPSAATRVAAFTALSAKSPLGALELLAFGRTDESSDVQKASIQGLGVFRDADGRASGTPYLIEFSRAGRESPLEIEALRALGCTQDPRALEFLLDRARSVSALPAVAALEALRGFEPELCRATCVDALRHAEPEVTKAALQALSTSRDLPEHEVVECLSHPVWDVRRLAADVLGHHPSESAREALSQQLRNEGETVVRDAIVRSLGRYEAPGALKTIRPPEQWQPE